MVSFVQLVINEVNVLVLFNGVFVIPLMSFVKKGTTLIISFHSLRSKHSAPERKREKKGKRGRER